MFWLFTVSYAQNISEVVQNGTIPISGRATSLRNELLMILLFALADTA